MIGISNSRRRTRPSATTSKPRPASVSSAPTRARERESAPPVPAPPSHIRCARCWATATRRTSTPTSRRHPSHERGHPHRAARRVCVNRPRAVLRRDPEEWIRLAQQSRGNGAAQQALYCYAKAYAADPDNVAVLWDRAALAREVNDLRAARASLVALLRRLPHNLKTRFESHSPVRRLPFLLTSVF